MAKRDIPKGIIIAHNPVSKMTGNGKTIAAMFYKWDKSDLAQIYITSQQPDFKICSNFYQITDKEVIASCFRRKKQTGRPVEKDVQKKQKGNAFAIKGKLPVSSGSVAGWFLRNFFWNRKSWMHPGFMEWIDSQAPDFVFLAAGNLEATFDMAEFIVEHRNVPLILHIGDDYYSKSEKEFLFLEWKRKRLSKRLQRVIQKSQLVIAISDKMAEKSKEMYGGNYITCMNCIDLSETYTEASILHEKKALYHMVYIGNLSVNRWQILPLIDDALGKVKERQIYLDIYSSIKDKKILKKISELKYVRYCGTVYGSKLHETIEKADILLILESFDRSVKRVLETAMSTKVPECLYAGRPILAVGPVYSGTIGYLYENELAEVVLEKNADKVVQALKHILSDREEIGRRIRRGKEAARTKFSLEKNSEMVFEAIADISLKGRMEEK